MLAKDPRLNFSRKTRGFFTPYLFQQVIIPSAPKNGTPLIFLLIPEIFQARLGYDSMIMGYDSMIIALYVDLHSLFSICIAHGSIA